MEKKIINTISPSAKALLLLKKYTDIPFAREMAEMADFQEKYLPNFTNRDTAFWVRVLHFEKRYKSISHLLEELPIKNVLEIASGYSLRSTEITKRRNVHYLDTDLPDIIDDKKNIIEQLKLNHSDLQGKLSLMPLNALDEEQFNKAINLFQKGQIAIVNEGLLMYLNQNEKEKLCRIIHKVLEKSGGYWITADIYIKRQSNTTYLKKSNKWETFFDQHNVKNNLFESFEEAESFFYKMGFAIDKEANVKRSDLSASKYLLKSTSMKQLYSLKNASEFQKTWRLRVI